MRKKSRLISLIMIVVFLHIAVVSIYADNITIDEEYNNIIEIIENVDLKDELSPMSANRCVDECEHQVLVLTDTTQFICSTCKGSIIIKQYGCTRCPYRVVRSETGCTCS